ncbi:hypothetical protein D3OALGA1CA_1915 [Olavius algarvensis associated proteobacterium Delta 3]|nr:hypothetical protein D3OALGA1CA_1915 [Olavius algarvensis associated proteobacterium Delta 3]CAB5118284.1 hypothetical protein D3OALGB2SA_2808 [Olavius algarvensis associated proteobacterium Delta 3]
MSQINRIGIDLKEFAPRLKHRLPEFCREPILSRTLGRIKGSLLKWCEKVQTRGSVSD